MDEAYQDAIIKEAISARCWKRGELRYKLKKCQLEMLTAIEKSERFKYFIKCSRRLGKSYLLNTMGNSQSNKKPGSQVRYAAPTAKMLRKIVHPIMLKILADCPKELKPHYKSDEGMYVYPNKSQFHLAGVNNNHADDLRGTECDLFLIDEAGDVDDLHYLIHDVALPQFLDPDGNVVMGRRLVVSGTPPKTPAHDFTIMAAQAEIEGYYSHYTIFDGEYPLPVIRMFLKEDGVSDADIELLFSGDYTKISSTTVKREYLAMDVVDSDSALVPEFKDDYVQEPYRDEYFKFYHKYRALDVGVRDKSVCLFAHYDYKLAKLFIHEECSLSGPSMTTELLASYIKETEKKCFDGFKMHKSVSDIDLLLINDLRAIHDLYFSPTDKGTLEQMINNVRLWVSAGRVIVAPHCKQLIGCLKMGIWNEARTDFARNKEYGHFDALAALMYLIRNVDAHINPIPPDYGLEKIDTWFTENNDAKRTKLKKAFGLK
jgi:hypothetical protein